MKFFKGRQYVPEFNIFIRDPRSRLEKMNKVIIGAGAFGWKTCVSTQTIAHACRNRNFKSEATTIESKIITSGNWRFSRLAPKRCLAKSLGKAKQDFAGAWKPSENRKIRFERL
jgi:hypothetical protein